MMSGLWGDIFERNSTNCALRTGISDHLPVVSTVTTATHTVTLTNSLNTFQTVHGMMFKLKVIHTEPTLHLERPLFKELISHFHL